MTHERDEELIEALKDFAGALLAYLIKYPDETFFHDRHHVVRQIFEKLAGELLLSNSSLIEISKGIYQIALSHDIAKGELHTAIQEFYKRISKHIDPQNSDNGSSNQNLNDPSQRAAITQDIENSLLYQLAQANLAQKNPSTFFQKLFATIKALFTKSKHPLSETLEKQGIFKIGEYMYKPIPLIIEDLGTATEAYFDEKITWEVLLEKKAAIQAAIVHRESQPTDQLGSFLYQLGYLVLTTEDKSFHIVRNNLTHLKAKYSYFHTAYDTTQFEDSNGTLAINPQQNEDKSEGNNGSKKINTKPKIEIRYSPNEFQQRFITNDNYADWHNAINQVYFELYKSRCYKALENLQELYNQNSTLWTHRNLAKLLADMIAHIMFTYSLDKDNLVAEFNDESLYRSLYKINHSFAYQLGIGTNDFDPTYKSEQAHALVQLEWKKAVSELEQTCKTGDYGLFYKKIAAVAEYFRFPRDKGQPCWTPEKLGTTLAIIVNNNPETIKGATITSWVKKCMPSLHFSTDILPKGLEQTNEDLFFQEFLTAYRDYFKGTVAWGNMVKRLEFEIKERNYQNFANLLSKYFITFQQILIEERPLWNPCQIATTIVKLAENNNYDLAQFTQLQETLSTSLGSFGFKSQFEKSEFNAILNRKQQEFTPPAMPTPDFTL